MRKVVNQFLAQTESQVQKIKKRVNKDTIKKTAAISKQVFEKIPKKDQLVQRFTAPLCTIKAQNDTEITYNGIKDKMTTVHNGVKSIKRGIDMIDRQINNVQKFIDQIKSILDAIQTITDLLSTIIKTVKNAITFIPAAYANVGLIVKLGDIIKVSEGMVEAFKANIEFVPKTLDYSEEKIKKVYNTLSPPRNIVKEADNFMIYHIQVLESVYLKYNKVCNVPNTDYTDNDGIINEEAVGGGEADTGQEQQNAVDDFLSADPTPENTLNAQDPLANYYTETISSLQAKGDSEALERLYRADLSFSTLDRKKGYEKIDISGDNPNTYSNIEGGGEASYGC